MIRNSGSHARARSTRATTSGTTFRSTSGRRSARAALIAAALFGTWQAVLPTVASGQIRRGAVLARAADVFRGDLTLGVGASVQRGVAFPLSGLHGDLYSPIDLFAGWGVADRVLLEARWSGYQWLHVRSARPSAIDLDAGAADGLTHGAGDLDLLLTFVPFGGSQAGWSLGGRLDLLIPSSNEGAGIGTNSGEVMVGAVGGYASPAWDAVGSVGVRIIEAPIESFVQHDLLDLALEVTWHAREEWEAAAGLAGQFDLASLDPPLGTEPRGEVFAGLRRRLSCWWLDLGTGVGITEVSPDWYFMIGLSWEKRR